jgi:transposase
MPASRPVHELEAEIERLRTALEQREVRLRHVTAERDALHHQLRLAMQKQFGPRTEKLDAEQLLLFAREVQDARDEADDDDSPELPRVPGRKRSRKRKPRRERLPDHLERRDFEHEVDDPSCPCCGEERPIIARETTERLEIDPPRLWVRRDVQIKRACPTCRGQIVRAAKPYAAIERSIAGSSLLAHLATSKFEDHLPLYRLEKILRRSSVHLPRSTQSDLLRQTADLLRPLEDLMWASVRGSPVIHTDDTTMPTLDRGRKRRGEGTRDIFTGRLWPYLGRSGAPHDLSGAYIVFRYSPTRAGCHVDEALSGWTGTIQGDCFAPYVRLDGRSDRDVALAACWAHARRGFHDAREADRGRAMRALRLIAELYAVESDLGQRPVPPTPEEVLEVRQERSAPIVERFMAWVQEQLADPTVLPKSLIGRALSYVLAHRERLERYLADGRLAIDNSIAERAIRPVAVGRKNFLFAGSRRGGQTMATLMSLVGSARLHGLDVARYLHDVIDRIAAIPVSRLPELLPDRWKAAQAVPAELAATTTLTS